MPNLGYDIYSYGKIIPFTERVFSRDLPMEIMKPAKKETHIERRDVLMQEVTTIKWS